MHGRDALARRARFLREPRTAESATRLGANTRLRKTAEATTLAAAIGQ
jgi:hypothetical protein